MHLVERLAAQPELRGEAFNFSNEIQVTVLELTQQILAAMGSSLQPDVRREVKNEIHHQYLTAAKARNLLNWSPSYDLDGGLKKTIAWYREFLA
jgi:CDP-glucose 4,6-dehydratase